MRRLLILLLPFLLFSCNKPDPQPELLDPIYMEFKTQHDMAKRAIIDIQAVIDEKKVDLDRVKPQTGQIKYAQKRYWEAQKTLDLLVQQEKYWGVRIQERLSFAQVEYLKAFKARKPWPDPKEFQEYESEKRLREARHQWDAKARIDKFRRENPVKQPKPSAAE